jgi:hypothetical protein
MVQPPFLELFDIPRVHNSQYLQHVSMRRTVTQGFSLLIKSALNYNGFTYEQIESTSNFSMQAAILSGLSNDLATITQQIPVRCPSGNCQWKSYESLSICSSCSDISQSLIPTTINYTIDNTYTPQFLSFLTDNPGDEIAIGNVTTLGLPNGLYVDAFYGPYTVFLGTSNKTNTVTFTENDALLWAMTMLKYVGNSSTGDGNPIPSRNSTTATECGLYYCVKNYSSFVVNGTLAESSSATSMQQSPYSWQPLNASVPAPPESDGQLDFSFDYPRTDLQFGDEYNISQVAINGIGSQMRSVFNIGDKANATGYYLPSSSQSQEDEFSPAAAQPLFNSANIGDTFNVLANSMSNSMRTNADDRPIVVGTNGITVYQVRWLWIILPFVAAVGSGIFLAITIYHQRNQHLEIWKSSSLATLLCGVKMGSLLEGEGKVGSMQDRARMTQVSLFNTARSESEVSHTYGCRTD